jgi:anaerobic selenocysteine-containing dehydrogenase
MGRDARDRHWQSNRVPRHARTGRAFERFPVHSRVGGADVPAQHHRPAGRIPSQVTVSACRAAIGETPNSAAAVKPNTPLASGPLGWPAAPEDLFIDENGGPVRIDKSFSWEYPLAVHGVMHSVITNAWRGDPYPIDTLMIFMANMAWNSSMNTTEVRKMLVDRQVNGE